MSMEPTSVPARLPINSSRWSLRFEICVEVPVRAFAYDAIEVADFDGDGFRDVAVASGAEGKLDVAFGAGDGTFADVNSLDFTVPGHALDPGSPIVGVHGCGDGPLQSIALVFGGLLSSFGGGPTPPCVARLRQSSPREFDAPLAADVLLLPTEPIGRSLAADFDQSPPLELLVAMRDEPLLVSLGLLRLGPNAFVPLADSVEGGAESLRRIQAIVFERAFPATATAPEKQAVFVVHEVEVDGEDRRRALVLGDDVVVIAHGTVVASGSPDELRARSGEAGLEDAFVKLIGSGEGLG
jgi:hypothetical protein